MVPIIRDTVTAAPRASSETTRPNHLVAIVACWPIAAPSLLVLTRFVTRTGLETFSLGSLLVYAPFAVALAGSMRIIIRSLTPIVVGIAVVLLLAFALLIMVDQDWVDYHITVATASLCLALPWLLVSNAVPGPAQFLRYLYVAAIAIVVAGAVRLYFPNNGSGLESYSQYAGYQMLPAVIIFIDDFLHHRRFRSAALLAIAVVLLLAAGARGPFLALVLFVLARAVLALRRRPAIIVVLLAAGLSTAQWFHVIVPAVLTSLARAFAAQGFSTRTIDRLIGGDFLEDRKRTALAGYTWDLIVEHPVTGVGLARDRPLLADAMGEHDPGLFRGWYPHNIFLELLVQWGLLLGFGLIMVISVVILRAVLSEIGGPSQRVVLIFVGIGLWPLLISGSYLTSPLFFALLGFCLASRRHARSLSSPSAPIAS